MQIVSLEEMVLLFLKYSLEYNFPRQTSLGISLTFCEWQLPIMGLKAHFPFVQRRMKTDHDLAKTDVLFLFLLVFFYFFFFWITLSVISFLRHSILITEKKIKWLLGNCTVFSILTFLKKILYGGQFL